VALPTLPDPAALLTLGVDTHAETHIAAALDPAGRLLATHTIPTTPAGSAGLGAWASTWGTWTASGGGHRQLRRRAGALAGRPRPGRCRGRPARPGRPTAPGQGR
jgi:hypothetical protein